MKRLTMLVHGPPGQGKSWLFATAPGPRLFLDGEGRAEHLPGHVIWWNPEQAPPDIDANAVTTDTTVAVDIRSQRDLTNARAWLDRGDHYFKSVGLDSVTEVQDRVIEEIKGTHADGRQDWGDIFDMLNEYIMGLKNLRRHPTNPLDVIYVVAGSETHEGATQPYVRGQLARKLPYRFDVLGYLTRQVDPSNNNRFRDLLIDSAGTSIMVKSNIDSITQAWPTGHVIEPDLGTLLQVINHQPEEASSE